MAGFPVHWTCGAPSSGVFKANSVPGFESEPNSYVREDSKARPLPPPQVTPGLAPPLSDFLSSCPPALGISLTSLSSSLLCRPLPPPRNSPAPSATHHASHCSSQLEGVQPPPGTHPPMRGSRGTLPRSGTFRSWHMTSAPPVVGGNI